MLFLNFYRCDRCSGEWVDVWSATCDDDCPQCGARHMSPYKSEDVKPRPQGVRLARTPTGSSTRFASCGPATCTAACVTTA